MKVGVQIGPTAGCAFYDEGRVLFAASEERYSNIKNDTVFPYAAIQDGMRYLGITPKEIEKVILVSQRMSPIHYLVKRETSFSIADYMREQNEYYKPTLLGGNKLNYLEIFSDRLILNGTSNELYKKISEASADAKLSDIWNDWRIEEAARVFGIARKSILIMKHETSHAAYGYYGSPFRGDDVLVVTCDGFGDEANATISELQVSKSHTLASYENFNIGRIYRYITLLLAMKPGEHEFKVMGLAPYASEHEYRRALEVFSKSYQFTEGEITTDPQLRDHFFYFRERLEGCRFDGIAGALQIFTERMMCDLVKYWMERAGKKRVVLSGGVSLNIKANMEVGKLDVVKDLFVVGSGGDESLCIGAIFAHEEDCGNGAKIQCLSNLYLGGAPTKAEIDEVINRASALTGGSIVVRRNVSSQDIAQLLASGKILGRVVGRMEFGARSLGNRSILADPRFNETIKKINKQIKNRDFWMPFTPSILDVDESTYLDNRKKFTFPYMSVACSSTNKAQQDIPAALHPADGTARPQVVSVQENAAYYDLISEFKKLTGVGALLNTSLNLHGYPMVRTPEQAYYVFEHSELDGIILEDNLILRNADYV